MLPNMPEPVTGQNGQLHKGRAMQLAPDSLAVVQALYDRGLCRQAYALGAAIAPLHQWNGVAGRILAGRIAINLGSPRLALRQHVRAFCEAPQQIRTQAYYLEAFLGMRGPVLAWERFSRFEKNCELPAQSGEVAEGHEYLFTLGARICGHLRDFSRADEYLKIAEKHRSSFPWLLVEQATLLGLKERWEDAARLAGQALEISPWYRPAVQSLAQGLHTLNRSDEALQLLDDASRHIESLPVLAQLASLQMDLGHYNQALETLNRAEQFSPIAERVTQQWIAAQRCRAACILGDQEQAALCADRLQDPYHRALAERLKARPASPKRVQLSIPFIQQFRLTCVPATLTMLCRFWELPAEQVDVAEAICYDGTPSHKARRWAETHGLVTREFTLNWDLAVALLDRQIPIAVYTAEATTGHVQVLLGYDELRRVFIFRNPAFPQIQEAMAEQFLARYSSTGPAGMVVIPAGQEQRLEGLTLPDADLYDRLRRLQQALELHHRSEAQAELAELQNIAPRHWLTLTAARVLHSYDTNVPALMECLTALLDLFPADTNLCLSRVALMRETAPREARLKVLKELCARKSADPFFYLQLAGELMSDARRLPEASVALKKVLRMLPLDPSAITTLANLYWNQRRFDDALELYRFAACLDAMKEPPAFTYFAAANARRQTEPALSFLQERWHNNGAKSSGPFITWFNALQQIGRPQEALSRLEEALLAHPDQGELWLAAADAFARYGNLQRAEECLSTAESRVHRAALLKVKADLAKYRTEPKTAITLLREVLESEPLSIAVHRSLVLLVAETEGREAALKYLEEVCGRFPHHYQLNQLWADWARGAGPEQGEKVARALSQTHPSDAWARRQLAIVLCDGGRFEQALLEAEEAMRLAPEQAVSLATRAHVRLSLGQLAEAQQDFREAIKLSVDFSLAIQGLVNSFHTLTERQAALAFIEQELVRQVVFGESLRAYREAARLNLEPAALLNSLRAALRARPDLAVAWSVTVQQLAEMLELDEAVALAQQTVERFPLLEQAWLDLALVQRLRLDAKGEQAALEQGMLVNPVASASTRLLGQFYERGGDTQRAKELLDSACARAPLDALNHGALAGVLWRLGQQPAALERLRHALRLNPGYGWGWQTLGAWATAAGQPKLAEELARTLLLQRPGEVRCMLVLARLLASTKRLEEALALVNETGAKFERNTETHELRAEILGALGRHAEADAACVPGVFGTRPPAVLRACQARLEAQRGNLVSAIARMKEVLQENPGYSYGWQALADWLWQRKEHEAALNAVTNLRRLEPLNPVPLGYRASMKLQKNDRSGAKADLDRALRYEPGYAFAALNLFDLQLADRNFNESKRILELIQRYIGGERAKACEVKFEAKFPQVPASTQNRSGPPSKQLQAVELEPAFARFEELCTSKTPDDDSFAVAIKALLDAGQARRVEQILATAIQLPECNPAVGVWWMRRRIAHYKWLCPRAVSRLCPKSPAARRAVITLLENLGQPKAPTGRTILLAYALLSLAKATEKQVRGAALWWLARRHRDWLRQDNDGWGAMGFALVRLGRFRAAKRWMCDWRQRPEVKMWMLLNLSLALRARRRWSEAREVLAFAVKLNERDHTFDALRLLLALELALAGETREAAAHFHELNSTGWSKYLERQYRFTQGLLAVQQADAAERKKIFRAQRAAIRSALGQQLRTSVRAEYRRCMTRMAKDAGRPWMRFFLGLGF